MCNTFTQLAAALADATPDWLCPLLGEAPGCAPPQRVRLVCASQVRRDPPWRPRLTLLEQHTHARAATSARFRPPTPASARRPSHVLAALRAIYSPRPTAARAALLDGLGIVSLAHIQRVGPARERPRGLRMRQAHVHADAAAA